MDAQNETTGEVLEITPITAIAQQHEAAAMDIQVATAQALGRSISDFQNDLEQWACYSQETAEECTYVLKKGGTRIVGPSIRFAELLQVAYRHIVVDTFIESEEFSHVVVGAMARDLFRNVAVRARVRRNILKRDKKTRFQPDMIQTTVQAAASLALRNAIIRLIPKALWMPVWLKSRDVAQGVNADGERVIPFSESVTRAMKFLGTFEISEQEILEHLGHGSRADLDADDLTLLRNKARAIRSGELDPHDAFPAPTDEKQHGEEAATEVAGSIKEAAAKAAKKKAAKKKAAPKKKAAAKKPKPEPEPEPQEEPADDDGVPDVDL